MKGMFDFLEKAGLVTRDPPGKQPAGQAESKLASAPPSVVVEPVASVAVTSGTPLNLDAIYADAGIKPAIYPAERLLRLIDGLSAMDAATRLMAITAMDAADESWTIADPLANAAEKVTALAAHGEYLKRQLQHVELESQSQLDRVLARQEQAVSDIRKQISELEALVTRELARAAQESATLQTRLTAVRDQTNSDLAEIARVSERLQGLSTQFGANPNAAQK